MKIGKYRNIVKAIPEGFAHHKMIFDGGGKPVNYIFLDVNEGFEKMTGLRREEILRRKVTEVLPEMKNDEFPWIDAYGKVAMTGEPAVFKEYSGSLKKWFEISAFSDKKGHFSTIFRDITKEQETLNRLEADVMDRERLEGRLREEQDQMLSVLNNMSHLIYVVDFETREILFINKYGRDAFGDLVGKNCWEEIHPEEDGPCSFCRLEDLKEWSPADEKILNWEYFNHVTKRWYDCTDRVIRWTDGRIAKLHVAFDITDRKEALKQDRFISAVMMNVSESVAIADTDFRLTYANKKTEELYGYTVDELMGQSAGIFNVEGEREEIQRDLYETLIKGEVYSGEALNVKKDGTEFICEMKITPLKDDDGVPYAYVGIQRDVTERVRMEEEIHNEKEKLRTTLLSVGDGIISTDPKGRITMMNKVAEYLTGWTEKEAEGMPLKQVFRIAHEFTKKPCDDLVRQVLLSGEIIELASNTVLISKAGKEIPVEDSAAPIKDRKGKITGVVIVFRDYTEKREKQREVEYLSFHDHLTGLYNRRYLEDAISRLDTRRNLPFTVVVCDVNGLKLTNDAYGHDAGDQLLKTVAKLLKNECREDDIIARTGGDEFVILLPQTNEDAAEAVVERIRKETAKFVLDSVIVSLALGYAVKTDMKEEILDIQKEADNRMYKDKLKHGKQMRSQTIATVLKHINQKYDREQIHTERVSQYCEAMGRVMGFSEEEVKEIKVLGELHDIGKINVSPEILNKGKKLTREEWEKVKIHSVTGYNILKGVEEYSHLAEIVLHHHERFDGKGYPEGLKGSEIPLYSRILAVVDAYEAMTANRSYQQSKVKEDAIRELEWCAGAQFDPDIVKVFIEGVLNE